MPGEIEPRAIIEAGALDDQSVAIPMPDRVTHEARLGILGKHAPIEKDWR